MRKKELLGFRILTWCWVTGGQCRYSARLCRDLQLQGGPWISPTGPSRSSAQFPTSRAAQPRAVGARAPPGHAMAFAEPPPKAHCFFLNVPKGSTIDDIIDALEVVTGPAGVKSLQHMGGVKFGVVAATDSAASKIKNRRAILLKGVSVPVLNVGPEIVHVSVFRVPLWVADASVAAALSAYGD
ncbi:hypothetical protein V5799_025405 [Amblyomma americanum]|uniref:Secreted protein n=1 Tax=Amblyomma americanum TaxID=6943 RepID=A0AAQ4E9B5_AMBAM